MIGGCCCQSVAPVYQVVLDAGGIWMVGYGRHSLDVLWGLSPTYGMRDWPSEHRPDVMLDSRYRGATANHDITERGNIVSEGYRELLSGYSISSSPCMS